MSRHCKYNVGVVFGRFMWSSAFGKGVDSQFGEVGVAFMVISW